MTQPSDNDRADLGLAQALELSRLVELEARWENLPQAASSRGAAVPLHDLQGKQKAYEAYRARMAAYNRLYRPAHVAEVIANTPARLGEWCRAMRDLYLRAGQDPRCVCPAQVVEKAYRWADKLAVRSEAQPAGRGTPPANVRSAIRELDALADWCASLTAVAAHFASARPDADGVTEAGGSGRAAVPQAGGRHVRV